MTPYLPQSKRSYIFGDVTAVAAQYMIWLLPEIQVPCVSIYSLLHIVTRGSCVACMVQDVKGELTCKSIEFPAVMQTLHVG